VQPSFQVGLGLYLFCSRLRLFCPDIFAAVVTFAKNVLLKKSFGNVLDAAT